MTFSAARNLDADTISISRFNKGEANKIFSEVRQNGQKIVLKNNRREAVILSPEMYDKIVDMLEDVVLLEEAVKRDEEHGRPQSFREVMKKAGITEEEVADFEEIGLE